VGLIGVMPGYRRRADPVMSRLGLPPRRTWGFVTVLPAGVLVLLQPARITPTARIRLGAPWV